MIQGVKVFKVSFYFFIVVFLSACSFGKKDEVLPSPGLLPPSADMPSPGLDPQNGLVVEGPFCFVDVTLKEVRGSQKKSSTMTEEELKSACSKANSQVKNIINEAVPKLTTSTDLNEAKIQLVMDKVETDLNLVLELFPLSKVGKETLKAKSQFKVERAIFQQAEKKMKDQFLASEEHLATEVSELSQVVQESTEITEKSSRKARLSVPSSRDYYQKEILDKVNAFMEEKYERRDLAVLANKGLGGPREKPYEFRAGFVQKNQDLYDKLRVANPYHEQGIRGRNCGLSALEVVDEELAKGEREKADLAYRVGEKMLDITLGELPLGVESVLYSFCTGKDLFTGAIVSEGSAEDSDVSTEDSDVSAEDSEVSAEDSEVSLTLTVTVDEEEIKKAESEKRLMEFIGSKEMMVVLEQIKARAMKKSVPKALVTDLSADSMDSSADSTDSGG